jgi:hypothetical protein
MLPRRLPRGTVADAALGASSLPDELSAPDLDAGPRPIACSHLALAATGCSMGRLHPVTRLPSKSKGMQKFDAPGEKLHGEGFGKQALIYELA